MYNGKKENVQLDQKKTVWHTNYVYVYIFLYPLKKNHLIFFYIVVTILFCYSDIIIIDRFSSQHSILFHMQQKILH